MDFLYSFHLLLAALIYLFVWRHHIQTELLIFIILCTNLFLHQARFSQDFVPQCFFLFHIMTCLVFTVICFLDERFTPACLGVATMFHSLFFSNSYHIEHNYLLGATHFFFDVSSDAKKNFEMNFCCCKYCHKQRRFFK